MSWFPEPYEESALPEPSLTEIYGQLAQMMWSLENRIRVWGANAPATDESLARFGQFLAREGLQGASAAPPPLQPTQSVLLVPAATEAQQVTPPTTTPLMGAVQPQAAPIPAQERPMRLTISHRQGTDQGVLVSPLPSVHQPYAGGRKTRGQSPEMGSAQKQADPDTPLPVSFPLSLQQTHAVGKAVRGQVPNDRLAQGQAGQAIPPLEIMKQVQLAVPWPRQ